MVKEVEGFYTVSGKASAEQVIEKSKFIAVITNVASLSETEQQMKEIREEFPNARHYVYAYRLHEGRLEKASDDGEPQGTGGRPVLDLLQHRQIWNVQVVVVRYFGGVLLGTGGLTRAYSGTTGLALNEAGITWLIPNQVYHLQIPYSWYEQVKYGFRQKGWDSEKEEFGEGITLDVAIPEGEVKGFESWLDEFTNKQVSWEKAEIELRPNKA